MPPILPPPGDSAPVRNGQTLSQQALAAQTALLPYALVAFALGAPIFIWAGSYAPNAPWMGVVGLSAAAAWAVFYGVVDWLKRPAAQNLTRRARVHLLSGLLWAGVTAEMAAFAYYAGPVREPLLLISVAAAAICIFFTAPWLPAILIVAPAAAIGPLVAIQLSPERGQLWPQALGAVALTLALVLILNRTLRSQFELAAEREALITERARKMDEQQRLARSKSDLISTLSSEIRHGLTGVVHVLAAAAGGGRAAPSREQLAAALEAANELIGVLDTTLDSETAESGKLAVEARAFDALPVVREVVAQLRPAAAAKGLEIAVHVDPELTGECGAAVADPARARQILVNLIGNAVKFTVRGRIEARVERGPDGRLSVEVADTGPGLSEAELAQAFEPFPRIARTCAGTPGAGLGLSLSRQLARLMGGEVSAHSAVGVGSCFKLILAYDPAAPRGRPQAVAEVAEPGRRGGRALRILAAEDDSLDAAMLRSVLEQLGHKVVQAADPRRALDLARSWEFDLAVVAARMTLNEGESLIAALPGALARAAPIVGLIGGDPDEAATCEEAGARVILRRPVAVGATARAIAEALGQDGAVRQVA
ncbi:MAG: ATP-binding protein [Phenylobacterium sp.]